MLDPIFTILQVAPPQLPEAAPGWHTGGWAAGGMALVLALVKAVSALTTRLKRDEEKAKEKERLDQEKERLAQARADAVAAAITAATEAGLEAAKAAVQAAVTEVQLGDPACRQEVDALLKSFDSKLVDFLHAQEVRDVKMEGATRAISDILGSQERLIQAFTEVSGELRRIRDAQRSDRRR